MHQYAHAQVCTHTDTRMHAHTYMGARMMAKQEGDGGRPRMLTISERARQSRPGQGLVQQEEAGPPSQLYLLNV